LVGEDTNQPNDQAGSQPLTCKLWTDLQLNFLRSNLCYHNILSIILSKDDPYNAQHWEGCQIWLVHTAFSIKCDNHIYKPALQLDRVLETPCPL